MKKGLLALGAIGLIALASVYVIIPDQLVVSKIILLHCNVNPADKFLSAAGYWAKWWPASGTHVQGHPDTLHDTFVYGDIRYQLTKRYQRKVDISIQAHGLEIASALSLFPLINLDSTLLEWRFDVHSSLNPWTRLRQYQQAKDIKNNMTGVTDTLRTFLEKMDNTYGIRIQDGGTTDSLLVTTSTTLPNYPGTADIYSLVEKIRLFLISHGAGETGSPMVNITAMPQGRFQIQVALPTNKSIPDQGTFHFRKLINGKYLEAEVQGGPGTVNAGFDAMSQYISDYRRTIMAIPFQSLITDRSREPDSNKWVTKLYYPIY